MSRTVSALVTWDDTYLGAIGPVAVGVPWWVEVEPVVAWLHEALGVPVLVLRLRDGIEPSERIYHQGDPAASVRAALKAR